MAVANLPPDDDHRRPPGLDDATVAGVGRVTEALEWIERARGRLFDFHQMIGHADAMVEDAADQLEAAGHGEVAARIRKEIIGRNVLPGRWTFQMIEEFEDTYYLPVRHAEQQVRDELCDGKRHLFEAELKEQRRTRGLPGHESRPGSL